jgi:hypothetical protein
LSIEIEYSSSLKQAAENIYQIQNGFLSYSGDGKYNKDTKTITIEKLATEADSRIFILSLSEEKIQPESLKTDTLLENSYKLEREVLDHHVLNDVSVQNKKIKQRIDELWCRQKGLNPDRIVSKSLSSDNSMQIWTNELIQFMGWNSSIFYKKSIIEKIGTENGPFKDFFYSAYFTNRYSADEICEMLQTWWDQYSLPLYRMKLTSLINTDLEMIFIIYLLALRMQLPWSELLYVLCDQFNRQPLFALLACLNQIAVFKIEDNDSVQFIPGNGAIGNMGLIKREEIEYIQSTYNKISFTSITKKNIALVKINKKVTIVHNKDLDHLTILPAIQPYKGIKTFQNVVTIKVEQIVIEIPLLWKDAEVILPGCRIRWIFKKDRFQFTCQSKKHGINLKIDDQDIDFEKSSHVKHFYPVKTSKHISNFKLYDGSGKSYLLNDRSASQEAHLSGWELDRNGQFVTNYTIGVSSRHHPIVADPAGCIKREIKLNKHHDKIDIFSKKSKEIISINVIIDSVRIKIMKYHHGEGKGVLVMVLDDSLKNSRQEFEALCFSELGFLPFIVYKSEIKKKASLPHMIFVGPSDIQPQVSEIRGLSKSPMLSINYPDGLRRLYQILRENS